MTEATWRVLAARYPSIVRQAILQRNWSDSATRQNVLPAIDQLFSRRAISSPTAKSDTTVFLHKLMGNTSFMHSSSQPFDELTDYIGKLGNLLNPSERMNFLQKSIPELLEMLKSPAWEVASKSSQSWRQSILHSPLFTLLLAEWPVSKGLIGQVFENIPLNTINELASLESLESLESPLERYNVAVYLFSIASPRVNLTTPAPSDGREELIQWHPNALLLFPSVQAQWLLQRSFDSNYSADISPLDLANWEPLWDIYGVPESPNGLNREFVKRALAEAALAPPLSFSTGDAWPFKLTTIQEALGKTKDGNQRASLVDAMTKYTAHTRSLNLLISVVSSLTKRVIRDYYPRKALIDGIGFGTLVDLVSGKEAVTRGERSKDGMKHTVDAGDQILDILLEHTRKALAQPDFAQSEYEALESLLIDVLRRRVHIALSDAWGAAGAATATEVADLIFPVGEGEERGGILGFLLKCEEIRLITHRQAKRWASVRPDPMSSFGTLEIGDAREPAMRRVVGELDRFEEDRFVRSFVLFLRYLIKLPHQNRTVYSGAREIPR